MAVESSAGAWGEKSGSIVELEQAGGRRGRRCAWTWKTDRDASSRQSSDESGSELDAVEKRKSPAGFANLEAGSGAKIPIVQEGPLGTTGSLHQADRDARDHALQVGASINVLHVTALAIA